jgi:CcmD family protein
MTTFLAAYIVVWLGVAVFVARLGKRQRTLQQTLDEIEEQVKRSSNNVADDEQRQLPSRPSHAA